MAGVPLLLAEEAQYLLNNLSLIGIFKEENREVKILIRQPTAHRVPHSPVAVCKLRAVIFGIDTWQQKETGEAEPGREEQTAGKVGPAEKMQHEHHDELRKQLTRAWRDGAGHRTGQSGRESEEQDAGGTLARALSRQL